MKSFRILIAATAAVFCLSAHAKNSPLPSPKACTPHYQCAVNCTHRGIDGSCENYGADFCGPDANCAVNCTQRGIGGNCESYDVDFCGPNANCAENCTHRGIDGSCESYGPDLCF